MYNNIAFSNIPRKVKATIIFMTIVMFVIISYKYELFEPITQNIIKLKSYDIVVTALSKNLVISRRVQSMNTDRYAERNTYIYVLGGTKKSMEYKLKTAADLFKYLKANKICILSEPGNTEYSQVYNRNLTNDEWKILKLKENNVDKKDIEFKNIDSGFFGTFSEAEGIYSIAKKRGVKRLILVTSNYHTIRTWKSFMLFNNNNNIDLYIYGAEEKVGILLLSLEHIKNIVYNIVLIKEYSF